MHIPSYFAHSAAGPNGAKDTLQDHLRETARLASAFASVWGAAWEGELAGWAHDLGKYGDRFQEVLQGRACRVDHATPGALAVARKYGEHGLAAAAAIEGHHEGLQIVEAASMISRLTRLNKHDTNEVNKTYSCRDIDVLHNRFVKDGGVLPERGKSLCRAVYRDDPTSAMLDIRMLFSVLVDADFLATEAHFCRDSAGPVYRPEGPVLDPVAALHCLEEYRASIRQESRADPHIAQIREEVYQACMDSAAGPVGTYTLTAPTGSGKTLAMMTFALKHAQIHALRRVIVVLPYLNLIEQTADTYARAFRGMARQPFVLEDHSMIEVPDDGESATRRLADNWDAPVIVTTTVRFFEALFSNISTVCRRLHRIARSVVLFDEAQSMPAKLVVPTLAALGRLSSGYSTTVLFSTATQPAYDTLRKGEHSIWKPKEMIPARLGLFERSKRVSVDWPTAPLPWQDLADSIAASHQALVIVNLRRHARSLYAELRRLGAEDVMCLSTDLCPAHRVDVLAKVVERLKCGLPCRLVSTQCVEAGVDLDFPEVWRAMAPLEAIIQSAGRCNRNGRQAQGRVRVFIPPLEDEKYPSPDYHAGTTEVKRLLHETGGFSLDDIGVIRRYYESLFGLLGLDEKSRELQTAISSKDFPQVEKIYRWIGSRGANVVVPYKPLDREFDGLAKAARSKRLDAKWFRRARRLAVNAWIAGRGDPHATWLEPIMADGREVNWYVLTNRHIYSQETGLDLRQARLDEFVV